MFQNVVYDSIVYDLSHLNTFLHDFEQNASNGKPAQKYRVAIRFSHHCFTEGRKPSDDPQLEFIDLSPKRDHRSFDAERWELSKRLPEIVKGLMERHIAHTNHNSFFTIEVVLENVASTNLSAGAATHVSAGARVDCEIYFEVVRVKGKLYLTVTSAFPRDPARIEARPHGGKIRFATILYNVLHSKPIKSRG